MKGYYVTAKRGKRTAWLYGPIADHGIALNMVNVIRDRALAIDPFCAFDAFGTSSIESDNALPVGRLNDWSI